jgi:DNA-binding SARP family transcriptional activator
MDTSILQVVTPELAEIVSGQDAPDVARLTLAAERLTLLSRLSGGPRTHQRYHPLVREFLEARFRSIDGPEAVADLHRRTAAATSTGDWRIAAYHYREAGDIESVLDVVAAAIPTIMGNGQYALAEGFIGQIPAEQRPASFDLILSRVDMQHGDYESAIAASQAVLDSNSTDVVQHDHALLNLVTLYLNFGDGERAGAMARELAASSDPNLRMIAKASISVVAAANSGSFDALNRQLIAMARTQRESRVHYFGVTQLNLAANLIMQDRPDRALAEAEIAVEVLEGGAAHIEVTAARVACSQALAMLGRTGEAEEVVRLAFADRSLTYDDPSLIETGELFDTFLGPARAESYLNQVSPRHEMTLTSRRMELLARCRLHIRRRQYDEAAALLQDMPPGLPTDPGSVSGRLVTAAYLAVARGDPTAAQQVHVAESHAQAQAAHRWRLIASLLSALHGPSGGLTARVVAVGKESPQTLTFLADLLVVRLHDLDQPAIDVIAEASRLHSARWRDALRLAIDLGDPQVRMSCARVLEPIGERQDVVRLRSVAKDLRRRAEGASLGRKLARRLAHRVVVEDLGRVAIQVGPNLTPGSEVRRKVLATLCYLISRPEMSATRDQVLDAMWPELDPDVATNSLNQTLYFLRRVFEEDYSEDLSPGYVHHDSDVIWLDPDLISGRSIACRRLIFGLPDRPSPDDVERLVAAYRGRFALDFEYEEWAATYRDSLHAAYLEIVERSVLDDLTNGHYDRGIGVARRVLEVEPTAEQVEVSLLRLYRATGAHGAAAEQYAHYAAVMREELGVEPPLLDAL